MNPISTRPTLNNFYNQSHSQNTSYAPQINMPSSSSAPKKIIRLETPAEDTNIPESFGIAALLQAFAIGVQKLSQWCGDKLKQGKEFTTEENILKTAGHMVNKNGLDVHVGYLTNNDVPKYTQKYGRGLLSEFKTVANGDNAFYMGTSKLAVAPKSKPSLILHELGHCINDQKSTFMRLLQKTRGWAASVPAAVVLLNRLLPKKEGEKRSFAEKYAGVIGFSAFLPTIIEEGAASVRGIKAAKKVLGKAVNLAPLRRNYAFAWCTYLLAGLGLGVAAQQAVVYDRPER